MSAAPSPETSSTKPAETPVDALKLRAHTPLTQQPGPKLFFAGIAFASLSALSTRRALVRRRLQAPKSGPSPRSPQASVDPPIQARQSASDTVLSKGQTSTPSTAQARQAGTAPGYASAAKESAEAASQNAGNVSAEWLESTVGELQRSPMVMALEAFSLATVNVMSWGMIGVGGALWRWDIRSLDELRAAVRGAPEEDGTGRKEQAIDKEIEEWIVGVLAKKEDKERVIARLKKETEKEKD